MLTSQKYARQPNKTQRMIDDNIKDFDNTGAEKMRFDNCLPTCFVIPVPYQNTASASKPGKCALSRIQIQFDVQSFYSSNVFKLSKNKQLNTY